MTFIFRLAVSYYALVVVAIIVLGLSLGGCANWRVTRNGLQEQPKPTWAEYRIR